MNLCCLAAGLLSAMSRLPTFRQGAHVESGALDAASPLIAHALSRMLRPHELWKQWASVLQDPDGEPMYLMQDIWSVEPGAGPGA